MNRLFSSLIGIGAVIALVAGAAWIFQSGGIGGWRCGGYGAGGYGMMGRGMGGGMIFLWVIVFIGIVLWVGSMAGGTGARRRELANDTPDAIEILNRRYARGEIEKAEYVAKRQDLSR